MDLLPFASITADKATRRHFDGGRVDGSSTPAHPEQTARASQTYRGAAALRARMAGVLYRSARAVEPCGYHQPATR